MRDAWLSVEALAAAVGIPEESVAELVRAGLVEPAGSDDARFTTATVIRLRRIYRLHHDLELELEAASIVVDLLVRLESLEGELTELRSHR